LIDNRLLLTAILTFSSLILAGIALITVMRGLSSRTIEQRLTLFAEPRPGQSHAARDGNPLGLLQGVLYRLGQLVRGRTRIYSEQDILALEGVIESSGFRPQNVLPVLLGIKVLMTVGVPAAVLLYGQMSGMQTGKLVLAVCLALPVGMLGPDWVLGMLRKPYLNALRRGVPDALDLLVVCSEAGMGLESALERVGQEMAHSNVAMSVALKKLLDDMRILPDRRDAFRNFADRTGVDGARRVATMMAQSMQYGTPLSQALRTVAIDLRRERMVALEGKAAKLPVMLTLPLILFIMPTLFIVLLGPSVVRLQDTMHNISK
jgi:tight adherence protein C